MVLKKITEWFWKFLVFSRLNASTMGFNPSQESKDSLSHMQCGQKNK